TSTQLPQDVVGPIVIVSDEPGADLKRFKVSRANVEYEADGR
mgnify:CR=1